MKTKLTKIVKSPVMGLIDKGLKQRVILLKNRDRLTWDQTIDVSLKLYLKYGCPPVSGSYSRSRERSARKSTRDHLRLDRE